MRLGCERRRWKWVDLIRRRCFGVCHNFEMQTRKDLHLGCKRGESMGVDGLDREGSGWLGAKKD